MSRNRTVLATARDGFIQGHGEEGLFICETRLLSTYRYRVNGQAPHPVGISNLEEHTQIAYYIFESPSADRELFRGALGPGGQAATEAIELQLFRTVGDGLQEKAELTNHTLRPASLTVELEIDADFADITEVHGKRTQHGDTRRTWKTDAGQSELAWTYSAEHHYEHHGNRGTARLQRSAKVSFRPSTGEAVYDQGANCVRFEVTLPPHGTWKCSISLAATIDGQEYNPAPDQNSPIPVLGEDKSKNFLDASSSVDLPVPDLACTVLRSLRQAKRDLIALRLYDLDRPDGGWTLAAGLPVYIALFGRDTLTASWQASLLTNEMMRGTLAELADTQAKDDNEWLDAQPGRFVHQVDTGPLAALMYNPHSRYYGSLTGPGFYPVVLSNLWHWTGDRELVRSLMEPALSGLAWLDRHAKLDHGFYAYQSRSEQGLKNQAWKDSFDAIVYPDGAQVEDPIAPAEFQAFVFAAKVRISELAWWLDQRDLSKRVFAEAITLRDRFNETFWMEEESCFGMGLDRHGKLIRSVGSETGHAIAAGIVQHDRAQRAIERLFEPDLFSGWGIRTLSAAHPAYNPFSYHRGSVWPAEQGAFSMGLMRYGLRDRLHQLCKAQFEAASLFEFYRLPELFSGHQRDDAHPIPALYPHADSPQAWSASAVWCMLQAMLGIFPYAPLHALFLDPHLPEWLPEIELKNVHVGDAAVDLNFRRSAGGGTDYRVLDVRGKLRVVRQPSPWSLTTDFGERVVDAISSVLPGH